MSHADGPATPPAEHGRHEAVPARSAGPWRLLFIILAVILVLAVVAVLLWIFVFSKGGGGGTPTGTPTQTATTTPTQTVTPPPLAVCSGDQITATLGDPEGAAGSTTVPIVFGNTGSAECTLEGYPVVFFIWEDGGTVGAASTEDTSTPAQQILVGPGNEAAKATLTITEAGDVCDAPVSTLGFRVTLPGDSTPIDISTTDYQACGDDTISLLQVGPIEEGGSG